MKKRLLVLWVLVCLVLNGSLFAQTATIKGMIQGPLMENIAGANLSMKGLEISTTTDSLGNFVLEKIPFGQQTLVIAAKGYETKEFAMTIRKNNLRLKFSLKDNSLNLEEVEVQANLSTTNNVIGRVDMQLRPVNSSQDLLRLVPGLFIAQHAGGGKAEQIFFRGFDVDHGTDFAIYVDGMPVNMTSHAHGQGYADLHFLIPETVRELEVNKGPYTTRYGDLATSGSGEFKTMNVLDKNMVKVEYGSFHTFRGLAMLNLLNKDQHIFSRKNENLYVAGEYRYTDSYFNNPQHFKRLNAFSKYSGILNNGSLLQISLSTFQSNWNASGQIPDRAVDEGIINRFGSIDPSEGGKTGRTNFNVVHQLPFKKGYWKNQAFYSRYDFNLYSNFTFYLKDSIHGDQINQADHRNIFGYNSTVQLNDTIGGKKLTSNFGIGSRYDNSMVNLAHTMKREFLNDIVRGQLNQLNAWAYVDENLDLTDKLRLNLGTRMDVFNFDFRNQTYDTASGQVIKVMASPKLNLFYTLNNKVQLFAKSGFGFHSNDARAVVVGRLQNTLARAFGYETGATFKPGKKIIMNVALWALRLQSELVYVGDDGIVEAAGRTQRYGVDLGFRYQLTSYWYLDADLNYNHGRLIDEPSNANHIPLAPVITSIGGISYKKPTGFGGSIRYRFMGNRAATEDYSLVAKGYTLVDAVVNYTQKKYQLGITIENLLNTKWKEAQFATQSRLKGESAPVTEIHFTPGTPFAIKGSVTVFF